MNERTSEEEIAPYSERRPERFSASTKNVDEAPPLPDRRAPSPLANVGFAAVKRR